MFNPTSIDSNTNLVFHGDTYEEAYLGATDADPTGIGGREEYYFYCDKEYESVKNKITSIQRIRQESNNLIIASLIPDAMLESSDHKYIFMLREPLGHFLLNNLMLIFNIHKKDKDAIFVIFTGINDEAGEVFEKSHRRKLIDFMYDLFQRHGINFYLLKSNTHSTSFSDYNSETEVFERTGGVKYTNKVINCLIYKARNFTVVDTSRSTMEVTLKDIKDYINTYICDTYTSNEDKSVKMYLSRGYYESEPDAFTTRKDSSPTYKSSSIRIYEEHLLEEYLKSVGFEIFKPHESESIEEQIKTVFSASVLVGSSGTGLVNSLFMENGKTVIELRTELGGDHSPHWLVTDYWSFSSAKNHLYIAVDLPDKQGATAVKKLKQLFNSLDLGKLLLDKSLEKEDLQ